MLKNARITTRFSNNGSSGSKKCGIATAVNTCSGSGSIGKTSRTSTGNYYASCYDDMNILSDSPTITTKPGLLLLNQNATSTGQQTRLQKANYKKDNSNTTEVPKNRSGSKPSALSSSISSPSKKSNITPATTKISGITIHERKFNSKYYYECMSGDVMNVRERDDGSIGVGGGRGGVVLLTTNAVEPLSSTAPSTTTCATTPYNNIIAPAAAAVMWKSEKMIGNNHGKTKRVSPPAKYTYTHMQVEMHYKTR